VTPQQIINHCHEAQARAKRPDVLIYLLLPGEWGVRNTKRLYPQGPVGRIVGHNVDGAGVRVAFQANEVLQAVQTFRLPGHLIPHEEETPGGKTSETP
jgi:hypothetical protein